MKKIIFLFVIGLPNPGLLLFVQQVFCALRNIRVANGLIEYTYTQNLSNDQIFDISFNRSNRYFT